MVSQVLVKRVAWFSLMVVVAGCGKAATSEPVEGKPGGYAIECAEKAHCVARAQQVCGGRYQVVSEWAQPALLPDLPASDAMGSGPLLARPTYGAPRVAAWQAPSGNTGPALSDPALLRGLEVVCVN
jgi:hypothetical protein